MTMDDIENRLTGLESRVEAIEQVILQVGSLIKILKPVMIGLGLSLGLEIQGLLL